ncbi:hypothetical protein BDN72DRAFT_959639 [Pluteus cervinus]|uniref:Uncharacterized protein n=1 Tax=Pluteus cervinus TaxID=181527 RepID=A0ACD3AWL7_9AGAR|nr:hypothetical protein BDN72DRAFT_959639 [Pluteus cervinus]
MSFTFTEPLTPERMSSIYSEPKPNLGPCKPLPNTYVSDYSILNPDQFPECPPCPQCPPPLPAGTEIGPFISQTQHWLPQLAYTPTTTWRATTGRCFPDQSTEIFFDYKGQHGQGVKIRDMRDELEPECRFRIEGPDDRVLEHTGLKKVTLRIIWPGYEDTVPWIRPINITPPGGPITRYQLGAVISGNFYRFLEDAMDAPNPSDPKDNLWSIGSDGIQRKHIILVSLINIYETIWQASVAVELNTSN